MMFVSVAPKTYNPFNIAIISKYVDLSFEFID